jgi:hypothetical protein
VLEEWELHELAVETAAQTTVVIAVAARLLYVQASKIFFKHRIYSAYLHSLSRTQYASAMSPPQPAPHARRTWIVVEGTVGRR